MISLDRFCAQYPVAAGQLLSPLLALSGVAAQMLAQTIGVSLPCLQNAIVYFFLFIFYQLPRLCGTANKGTQANMEFEMTERRSGCLQLTGIFQRSQEIHVASQTIPNNVVDNERSHQMQNQLPISLEKTGSKSCRDFFALKYFLLAFFDVQANVLVTLSFRYTTLTSVMLLDCFTIPFVMCLSGAFLGTKYSRIHFVGVGICLTGLLSIILSDALIGNSDSSAVIDDIPTRVWGDLLCIVGALCYAISNVWQEKIVKEISREEFLSMIGSWGVVIAFIQSLLFEDLGIIQWTNLDLIAAFGLYVLVIVLYYILVSKFLLYHDAAFLNISILTSDVWGIAFGYVIFHQILHWLYFVGFITVVAGAIIYNKEPVCHTSVVYNPNENEERGALGEEYEHINPDLEESLRPS